MNVHCLHVTKLSQHVFSCSTKTHESIQIDEVIFLRKKSDDAEFHQNKKMARNRISIGHKQTLFKDEN